MRKRGVQVSPDERLVCSVAMAVLVRNFSVEYPSKRENAYQRESRTRNGYAINPHAGMLSQQNRTLHHVRDAVLHWARSMQSALKLLLEKGNALVLLAIAATLIASFATFIWATFNMVVNAWQLLASLLHSGAAQVEHTGVGMVAALDALLMALVLYIFSVALYELFIGEIRVPEWLVIKSLDGLKEKLASVIILILVVTFLEHLVHWENAADTFLFGLAIASVVFALVFYMRHKREHV
jgi:uncharacterized membrane protein YqhA